MLSPSMKGLLPHSSWLLYQSQASVSTKTSQAVLPCWQRVPSVSTKTSQAALPSSILAARAKCLNQNESSCASLLAACAKCLLHKSSCASGFNCQFIVESDFEGAQAYDVSSDSIYHHHRSLSLPSSLSPRLKSTFIVVSMDYYHHCCRYCCRHQL
jgi:hypothetical protein